MTAASDTTVLRRGNATFPALVTGATWPDQYKDSAVPPEKTPPSYLLFRRNRYYDPATGQFTQQDPIGIAGGMNLYGFAGADPVNFTDPFGLCVPWPNCALAAAGAGAHVGTIVGGGVGSLFPGVGTASGAAIGRAAGAILVGGAATLGAAWIYLNAEEGGRSIDNPGSLEGATPEEVESLIPEGWVKSPSRRGGGTRYSNPNAPGEQLRVQPGNPRDPNPVKRKPYARVSKDGTVSDPIPLGGGGE